MHAHTSTCVFILRPSLPPVCKVLKVGKALPTWNGTFICTNWWQGKKKSSVIQAYFVFFVTHHLMCDRWVGEQGKLTPRLGPWSSSSEPISDIFEPRYNLYIRYYGYKITWEQFINKINNEGAELKLTSLLQHLLAHAAMATPDAFRKPVVIFRSEKGPNDPYAMVRRTGSRGRKLD